MLTLAVVAYGSIVYLCVLAVLILGLGSFIQLRFVKKKNPYLGGIVPLVSFVLVLILIPSIIISILTSLYFILLYLITRYRLNNRKSEIDRINIKDL